MMNVRGSCAIVAQRIVRDRRHIVGFVPSSDTVGVSAVMVQLGLALCDLTGATVAVVDPLCTAFGSAARFTDGPRVRWLHGSLALITAPRVERAGEVVPQLARMLERSDLFAHVLVDLTGFERLGDHATVAACMDGVALVGKAHHSREQELVELARSMPRDRFLGVLLVGSRIP
jgi:hypothetical protein